MPFISDAMNRWSSSIIESSQAYLRLRPMPKEDRQAWRLTNPRIALRTQPHKRLTSRGTGDILCNAKYIDILCNAKHIGCPGDQAIDLGCISRWKGSVRKKFRSHSCQQNMLANRVLPRKWLSYLRTLRPN